MKTMASGTIDARPRPTGQSQSSFHSVPTTRDHFQPLHLHPANKDTTSRAYLERRARDEFEGRIPKGWLEPDHPPEKCLRARIQVDSRKSRSSPGATCTARPFPHPAARSARRLSRPVDGSRWTAARWDRLWPCAPRNHGESGKFVIQSPSGCIRFLVLSTWVIPK